jgi:hypothetical protein
MITSGEEIRLFRRPKSLIPSHPIPSLDHAIPPRTLSTCLLHVGMPKTGTSSIQDSLWANLKDPQFHYIDLTGHSNGSEFMNLAFMDDPLEYWVYRRLGFTRQRVLWLKRRYQQKLRRRLRGISNAKQTAIISAEACWRFKPSELEAVHNLMREEGFSVSIIAYLRPMKSWIESNIQQNTKYGNAITTIAGIGNEQCMHHLAYTERLQTFASIFDNVIVREFTATGLMDGCVVSDFCRSLGIRLAPQSILRANESMPVDTVKMLYCFNEFRRTSSTPSLAANQLMLNHLKALKGAAFHLHSQFFCDLQNHIESENEILHNRYGIDLQEDLARYDEQAPCIRDLSDMMRFSRESLDWLAEASQGARLDACEGLATAQSVAKQLSSLLSRPRLALWRLEARVRLLHRIHVFLP